MVYISMVTLVHPTQTVVNFGNFSNGIWYVGHPLTCAEKFMEIVPRKPLGRGELNPRGVAKYSDFGPIEVTNH